VGIYAKIGGLDPTQKEREIRLPPKGEKRLSERSEKR